MSLEVEVGRRLSERGWRLAVAETTAGGLISSRLVSVPGSSAYFECGVVVYGRRAKEAVLGVPEEVLSRHGAVSAETARALAEAVRRTAGTEMGLAETGIAGPQQGRSPKPVGTAYLAISTASGTQVTAHSFSGDRTAIREAITRAALEALLRSLTPPPERLE